MTMLRTKPYSHTATDLYAALMGKRRTSQTVHVSTRVFRDGRMARALVLVVPEGSKTGEYFEVFSDRTIDALRAGTSPEELCLEPYEPESEDGEPEFTIRDHTRAMARSGAFGGR